MNFNKINNINNNKIILYFIKVRFINNDIW